MRRDDGTVLVYALAGALLVLAVILVLADTSSLFMRRSALMMVADNAAIAAANAIDVPSIYDTGVGGGLSLDPEQAAALAQAAVDAVDDARLADVRLDAVEVASGVVTVLVSAALPSPLSAISGDRGLRMRARASAGTLTRL